MALCVIRGMERSRTRQELVGFILRVRGSYELDCVWGRMSVAAGWKMHRKEAGQEARSPAGGMLWSVGESVVWTKVVALSIRRA